MDYSILVPEIRDDPLGRGYAGMSAAEVAADLAVLRRSRDRETIGSGELQAAVDGGEYAALSDVKRAGWGAILAAGSVDVSNENIRAQITTIWAAGTATRSNLAALQTENISRAAELRLGRVRAGDVQMARQQIGS